MKVIFSFFVLVSMLACSGDEADSAEFSEIIDNVDTTTETTFDLAKSYDIEIPPATVDDACLPYPSAEFCHLIAVDSAYKYDLNANYIYSYVVHHFDSLEKRKYTPVEDKWELGVYDWSQKFSDGIVFSESFGGEGGAVATLYTKCTNLEAVYSTLNAVVNFRRIGAEYEFDGEWNEEKTEYSADGAGCYYSIILDDVTGFYYIENYCGC